MVFVSSQGAYLSLLTNSGKLYHQNWNEKKNEIMMKQWLCFWNMGPYKSNIYGMFHGSYGAATCLRHGECNDIENIGNTNHFNMVQQQGGAISALNYENYL
jgi:hypothetical protein